MTELASIPEIRELFRRQSLVRIPDQLDVPVTGRVRQIIDSVEFRRLAHVSQLGLVSLVYPAANHSRFEHALGVYRLSLLYLAQLSEDERFAAAIQPRDAELFIVAALVHDIGHWPFCHPIEDIRLPGVPQHELFANSFLLEGELADTLRDDWGISPREIVSLLSEKPRDRRFAILQSLLSGPLDIDKMDYLFRDSFHAGVPYGRNFDQQRLIGSLCLDDAGTCLAIRDKGRTAAEMMVFSRYVMFSEVYWHHAVRSATAMLQRSFFLLRAQLDLETLFRTSEPEFIRLIRSAAKGSPAADLLDGLFGPTRRLYKRALELSVFRRGELHQKLARRPYEWLTTCAELIANELSVLFGLRVAPHEVLLDAPPVKREVEFDVDVYFPREKRYRKFSEVSPVVETLARKQFDDCVKQVRLFLHARLPYKSVTSDEMSEALARAIEKMDR